MCNLFFIPLFLMNASQMLEFTASVRSWLEADPKNIIAVHCKGGKGRTGTMICVWLVEAGLFSKAEDSLCYFGARRTDTLLGHTFQGVETPSQVSFHSILISYSVSAYLLVY